MFLRQVRVGRLLPIKNCRVFERHNRNFNNNNNSMRTVMTATTTTMKMTMMTTSMKTRIIIPTLSTNNSNNNTDLGIFEKQKSPTLRWFAINGFHHHDDNNSRNDVDDDGNKLRSDQDDQEEEEQHQQQQQGRRSQKRRTKNRASSSTSSTTRKMKLENDIPTYKEFFHRFTVLSLYRNFLKAIRFGGVDENNKLLLHDLKVQVKNEFKSHKDETNPFNVQRDLVEGRRRLQEVQAMTGYSPSGGGSGSDAVTGNGATNDHDEDSWMNTNDPIDPRGRVGEGWPWNR